MPVPNCYISLFLRSFKFAHENQLDPLYQMNNREDFYQLIRKIYDHACWHGIKTVQIDETNPNQAELKKFVEACHKGFATAQDLIVDNLMSLERQKKNLDEDLAKERRHKNKKNITSLSDAILWINYQMKILRKLADSIAWQMAAGNHFVIRRLFMGEPNPSLLSEGFNETRARTNELNSDPQSFALISDITSFIQIGDIFRLNNSAYELIEVKSGKKNREAQQIIDILNAPKHPDKSKEAIPTIEPKLEEQVNRIQRQLKRRNQATEILREEKGTDPMTGADVAVIESSHEPQRFEALIEELIQKSKQNTWAYDVIEGTVHIGVYRDFMRLGQGKLLELIVNKETGKNYPAYSYIEFLLNSICEPLFLKNLSDESKFELIEGNVSIYICINYEKIIESLIFNGYPARWASRKETQKLKERHKIKSWICVENRALVIDLDSEKSILGDGLIARIVADNLKPTVAINSLIELLRERS